MVTELISMAGFLEVEALGIIIALTVVTILRYIKTYERLRHRFDRRYGAWQEKRWIMSMSQEREENRRINGDPYADLKAEDM